MSRKHRLASRCLPHRVLRSHLGTYSFPLHHHKIFCIFQMSNLPPFTSHQFLRITIAVLSNRCFALKRIVRQCWHSFKRRMQLHASSLMWKSMFFCEESTRELISLDIQDQAFEVASKDRETRALVIIYESFFASIARRCLMEAHALFMKHITVKLNLQR